MPEKHGYGSFDYKVINKNIRRILDSRSRLNNTVQMAMPFVKATTTIRHSNLGSNDNIGFTLGLHAIDKDVEFEDMYSSRNASVPLIGYTYKSDGSPELVYSFNEFDEIQTSVANIFDKQAKLISYPNEQYIRVPPPGITSVTVGRNKNGLLASAQLQITIPTLMQLESLHRVFLIPGMGMVLEWGQQFAPYDYTVQNNGLGLRTDTGQLIESAEQYAQLSDISRYMFPWNNRDELNIILNRIARRDLGLEEILQKYVYPSNGQYMWMFGRIANFDIKSNSDGSFNATVKIVGPSEDAWAYSTTTTVVPRKDASSPYFCASDFNSIYSYFNNTTTGLNLKSLLDDILAGKKGAGTELADWKSHIIYFDKGNQQEEGEPKPGTQTPTVDEKGFGDSDDAYFMTWRFFVNVVINNEKYGIKAIFNRAGIDSKKLETIGLLLPYADGNTRQNTNIAKVAFIDDPKESFVGLNKYLRSIDPSVMIVVNETAAQLARKNEQYNIISSNQELLEVTDDSNKFSSIGWFDVAARGYMKDVGNPDRGFLSTGVWINHKALVEAMLGADTLLRGVVNLLDRMNAASMGYWQLVLDAIDGSEESPNPHSYIVVDANWKDSSENAVTKFIDNVHIFNKYVRKSADGTLVGSELVECSIDLSLPKRLFSQIATLGLLSKDEVQSATNNPAGEEAQSSIKISDPNDTLAKMFAITSLSEKDARGQGPDLTILPLDERQRTTSTCGKSNTQTVAGTGGQGYQAAGINPKELPTDKKELEKIYSGSLKQLESQVCKDCAQCIDVQSQQPTTTQLPPPTESPFIPPPGTCSDATGPVGREPYKIPPDFTNYQNAKIPLDKLVGVEKGTKKRYTYNETGGWYLLHPEAAEQYNKLKQFAKSQGVKFTLSSAYRDFAHQQELGSKSTVAGAGSSPHGWGGAIDIQELYRAVGGTGNPTKNKTARQNNALYKWMVANAPKFGWYNPCRLADGTGTDEIWHWEYWGFWNKPQNPSLNQTPITQPITPPSPTPAVSQPTSQPTQKTTQPTTQQFGVCDEVFRRIGKGDIEAGVAECKKCKTAKQIVEQVSEINKVQTNVDASVRKFSGLRKAFRYVEVFPDMMVASITDTADGNSSNAFGASPGSLSIAGNLVLPGINGLRIGELFWIDRIPAFYKAFGAFQIMSIEDTIGVDGWKTNVHARFNYLGNRWKQAMANKLNNIVISPLPAPEPPDRPE